MLALAAMLPSRGLAGRTQSLTPLDAPTWAFFTSRCSSCHNTKAASGGLDFATLRHADSITKNRDTWETILRKIRSGEMPPPGSPRPPSNEISAAAHSLDIAFAGADHAEAANPGRVTARHLNRAEYNNTIRDLLGVDCRPADDFPQDDSGYGFDDIGDVLSLSPSLMEMYVTAAEKVARTAVFGPERLQPTLSPREGSGRHIVPTTVVPAQYDVTGLTLPNSVHATHRFAADGEYLFRLHLDGVRPYNSGPVHLGLRIDGQLVRETDFDPTGQAAFSNDRQDFSGRTVEWRVPVTAGDHWIAGVIERMYEGLPASYHGPDPSARNAPYPEFKPPANLAPEVVERIKKFVAERRKEVAPVNDAHVSGLEVGGPYQQKLGPSEKSLRLVFTCGHLHGGHQPGCARKIVTDFGRRAFRRPLTSQEIAKYTGLISLARKRGDSFEEGVCLALEGMLVSPHFLYRIEHDPAANSPSDHSISQYELASRLSYFLWSTMPDEALMACADHGTLRKPEVLAAQVSRMLRDPRSEALAQNFAGQWLQFRALESIKPDRQRFPEFDEYLRMSMRRETELFFNHVVRDDCSVLDLLNARYTYLNERLAEFYGIQGVAGPEFRLVNLAGTPRAGILTQASVLTVTSYPNRTSPVLRGKWILENILNAPPPAPPPGVPNLDVTSVGKDVSLRQQLEQHRKNPTCAACHARMDPLGFGLENFDAIGEWRSSDGKVPIDSSGTLPDGRAFHGPDGLKQILQADSGAFTQCITAKLLTYALGRGLERYDQPVVKQIAGRVASHGYRFSSLVTDIVTSRPFQMRRGDRQS
jgi:hypothetical protein